MKRQASHHTQNYPLVGVLLFYLLCFALRGLEYLWLRTDQGVLGEAVWHKLAGIALLALALRHLDWCWRDIGMSANHIWQNLGKGLLLCGLPFAVAYAAEMVVLYRQGQTPWLAFYASSYTLQGNRTMQGGAFFVLVCVLGNFINVVMEEGAFRGLFMHMLQPKRSFLQAGLLSSLLFGFWHIALPVRNVLDGVQAPGAAWLAAAVLVLGSALLGLQYVMLLHITGTLWAGMAAHFFNNTIVNLLHVQTATEADNLMMLRITVAQTLSFILVCAWFWHWQWHGRLPTLVQTERRITSLPSKRL